MRPGPPVRPVHAGGLARWETLTFIVVFVLMAIFVAVVTVSSAHARAPQPGAGRAGPGPAAAMPAPQAAGAVPAGGGAPDRARRRQEWNQRLAAALVPVLRSARGHLAVGVVDRSTGAVAVYDAGRRFTMASIAKVDILATLLLQRQPPNGGLSEADQQLATTMIEASDDAAANRLWQDEGEASGMAAASRRLGLSATVPGPGIDWGLGTTTVGDQITLLRDLTAAGSPLTAAARRYVLSLMRGVDASQRWGVPAAATPGTSYAVKDGWLPHGRGWVINSVGVLRHGRQRLLLAVLSDGQPTEAAGIAAVRAAAVAAAESIARDGITGRP
jgi:beta-lactamase class A